MRPAVVRSDYEREAIRLICNVRSALSSLQSALLRSLGFGRAVDELYLRHVDGVVLEVLRAEYVEMEALRAQSPAGNVEEFEPALMGREHGRSLLLEFEIFALSERLHSAFQRAFSGSLTTGDWAHIYGVAEEVRRCVRGMRQRFEVEPKDAKMQAAQHSVPILWGWVMDDAEKLLVHAQNALRLEPKR